jgi:hypothetical protein
LAQRDRSKRKRRPPATAGAQPREPRASRSEAKNAAVRATLEPLEPGERPRPVTIGAIVALALVLVQIPLYLVWDGDQRPQLPGFLFFMALMLAMAWGMWQAKYWAVLGFQALLAACILIVSLIVLLASNVVTVLICAAIVVPAGALFWSMVRAMARIQMPDR